MKEIKKIESGANFCAISVGNISELAGYELQLSPEVTHCRRSDTPRASEVVASIPPCCDR